MHPAPSIIIFTTLSGLGYGLAAVLGLGFLDPAALATKLAYLLALALIAGGLLSSTLHLGNPQRAWRALTQWRSSWLSREGVLAILTFAPLSARPSPPCGAAATSCRRIGRHGARHGDGLLHGDDLRLAEIGAGLAHAADGGLLPAVLGVGRPCRQRRLRRGGRRRRPRPDPAAGARRPGGGLDRQAEWWRRLGELQPLSTPESATGLGFIGRVRLLERPHVNENYLTSEMGFRVARKHAQKLARIAFAAAALYRQ